jgi:adenylate cyclase
MYTDMVGYTALTQSNEAQAMQVLERHNRLLRPFFPRFHGREVKAIGDSFLVEFDSALDALKCASQIQSYLHDYNVSSKEEWKIKLRIGIHLGDVIHQGGDVFGDAVNIASRIYPIADPEGICVSQQVYDQVQNKFDLPLFSLGEKTLKNVSRPVQVYSVQMPWEQTATPEAAAYERRLTAIMFTDILEYSALAQKNEDAAMGLLEEHRRLVRPFFPKHNGREVKTMGDTFLVEFASALEAVRCALDIQQSMHKMNSGRSPDNQVQVRACVHLGDVIHSEGDVYGHAVNVASMIEPLAPPGGICVSEQVFGQVKNKFEYPLVSLGKKELKNVGETVEVFKVVLPWEQEEGSATPPLDPKRIAILPFVSVSPDPNDEYFADGMTEELISTTSSIKGLTLIARTSVMSYKGTTKRVEEIGKELSAGTVLEGSVRKAGNRLRITVQLVDAQSQGHLWAQSYDRNLDDIFGVQSDIAKRVAKALKVQMLPHEAQRLEKKPTVNTEAYALYLRALQLTHEADEHSWREAVELFNRAILKDPAFARAYAGLSKAWVQLAGGGYEGSLGGGYVDYAVGTSNAEAAATKALELDPSSAEAHAAMSTVHMLLDRHEKIVAEAEKAIEINPSLADAHVRLGNGYVTLGTLDQALAEHQKAYELDPLSFVGLPLAAVCRVMGKERDEMVVLEREKELHPNNALVYVNLAYHYMWKRDYVRTQEILDKGLAIDPKEPGLEIGQGMLYAITGRTREAQESLAKIRQNKIEANRLYGEVLIQTALGNLDDAFKALWRQAETHNWWWLIKYDPAYEGLRKDPRFSEFCKKVGLPP